MVCFAPRHNLTIANMEPGDLRKVVDTWVEQYLELGAADGDQLRTDFRKPRRHDGCKQSAPALPDLVESRAAERSRQGAGFAD